MAATPPKLPIFFFLEEPGCFTDSIYRETDLCPIDTKLHRIHAHANFLITNNSLIKIISNRIYYVRRAQYINNQYIIAININGAI